MNAAARDLIERLRLAPLPGEGGFFRQTSRTKTASAILFLLTPDDFSAWHRLMQDELWHFHAGDPVEHVQLDPRDGALHRARLGAAVLAGDVPQAFVPAGTWQAARPIGTAHGYSLVGCTVSPPWDEHSFALGSRDALEREFPSHAAIIRALTR